MVPGSKETKGFGTLELDIYMQNLFTGKTYNIYIKWGNSLQVVGIADGT